MSKKLEIKIGEVYWMLTITKEVESWRKYVRKFRCECECWNYTDVIMWKLRNWETKSCWCYKKGWKYNITHWLRKTQFYKKFYWILERCKRKKSDNYKYYWGKWIKCEWKILKSLEMICTKVI